MKSLDQAAVGEKRVLLRIATDVPLSPGSEKLVLDDTRLKQAIPTINYLLNRRAKIILLGHLGEPHGIAQADLSLRPVFTHLSALLKKPIQFSPALFGPATSQAVSGLAAGALLGLENLRFDKSEQNNSRTFAKKLAEYGEIYVDDAFSVSHRQDASTVAITEFLPSYPGLLLEKEYRVLTNLLRHPARPYVVVLGGAKVKDKLPLVRQLLETADRVLIGGGVANTFLAASGFNVKKSVVEKELLPLAAQLLTRGRGKIVLPVDHIWSPAEQIWDLGPGTIRLFEAQLGRAKTIFWNGNLGKSEDPAYRQGSDQVARAIANSGATTIVGGGNTTEIINRLNLAAEINFLSSGGGATLTLLGGRALPGIEALR